MAHSTRKLKSAENSRCDCKQRVNHMNIHASSTTYYPTRLQARVLRMVPWTSYITSHCSPRPYCLVRCALKKARRSFLHKTPSIPTSIKTSHHSTLSTDDFAANELKQCLNDSNLRSIQSGSNSSRCDPVYFVRGTSPPINWRSIRASKTISEVCNNWRFVPPFSDYPRLPCSYEDSFTDAAWQYSFR